VFNVVVIVFVVIRQIIKNHTLPAHAHTFTHMISNIPSFFSVCRKV